MTPRLTVVPAVCSRRLPIEDTFSMLLKVAGSSVARGGLLSGLLVEFNGTCKRPLRVVCWRWLMPCAVREQCLEI